ncbi:MAG: hypothetical protein JXR34_08945 [Bacteroidales bacterium]|nr:hypothetical protein [Bacteroidales bacterium]
MPQHNTIRQVYSSTYAEGGRWSQPVSTGEFLIDRGYKGHACPERSRREMLDEFEIINMNGRLYDPVIARFFSPDPGACPDERSDRRIQAPDFSQNYNRYSYVMNNPLVYTDPSGEFFGSILTAKWDFGTTIFTKGGLEFWNWRSDYVQNAWRDFDPSGSWSKTNKAWRIDVGLLKTDPNRTVVGRGLQFASRFLWELPQTLLGNVVSHARNITGNVDNVSYYGGATLVNNDDPSDPGWWGFSLGSYINSKNMEADPYTDAGFRHEYGHTLQSRLVGPMYLTRVGIPSLIGSGLDDLGLNDHDREWYETQANRMSERYFRNQDSGALTALPWDNNRFPRDDNPNWYWMFAHPNLPFMWWLFF